MDEKISQAKRIIEGRNPFSKLRDMSQFGNPKLLKMVLSKSNLPVNSTDNEGKNLLYYAVANGNKDNVDFLLHLEPELIKYKGKDGKNLLHIFSLQGMSEQGKFFKYSDNHSVSILNNLIKANIDVNEKDEEGNTPLHDAIIFSNNVVVEQLIKNGAKLDIRNNYGDTPMDTAFSIHNKLNREYNDIKENLVRNMKKLVDMGVDFNQIKDNGKTILIEAIENNNLDVVKFAVALKIDLNKKDAFGNNALHHTASTLNLNVMRILMNGDVDINSVNNKKQNAPMIALDTGYMCEHYISYYLDNYPDFNINHQDENGNTLLHYCYNNNQIGNDKLKQKLIDYGIDVNIKNNDGLKAGQPKEVVFKVKSKESLAKKLSEKKALKNIMNGFKPSNLSPKY